MSQQSQSLSVKASYQGDVRRFPLGFPLSFAKLNDKIKTTYALTNPRIAYVDSEGDYITVGTDDDLSEAVSACAGGPLRLAITEQQAASSHATPLATPSVPSTPAVVVESLPRIIPVVSSSSSVSAAPKDTAAQPVAMDFEQGDNDAFAAGSGTTTTNNNTTSVNNSAPVIEEQEEEQEEQAQEEEEPPQPQGPQVHTGVVCDGCKGSIVGRRFKCRVCPDYDLCEQCEQRNLHSEHPMVRFCAPVRIPYGWGGRFGGGWGPFAGGCRRGGPFSFGVFVNPDAQQQEEAAPDSDKPAEGAQGNSGAGCCPMRGGPCGGPRPGGFGPFHHGPHHHHHAHAHGHGHGHGGEHPFFRGGPFGAWFGPREAPPTNTTGTGTASAAPTTAGAGAPTTAGAGAANTTRPRTVPDVEMLRDMGFDLDDAVLAELLARFEGNLAGIIAHLCDQ